MQLAGHLCVAAQSIRLSAYLHGISADFLHFKGVDDPHRDVANQQEGDHLAARLCPFVLWQVDTAPGHICDEQQLEHNLKLNHFLVLRWKHAVY